MPDLNNTIKQFDTTEANLAKLERIWSEIEDMIPSGTDFGDNPDYDDKCRAFRLVLEAMPSIDGYGIEDHLMPLWEILQARVDATDSGMAEHRMATEETIYRQGKVLREYRFRYIQARKTLIRDAIRELAAGIENLLSRMRNRLDLERLDDSVTGKNWTELQVKASQMENLFGSMKRPDRWDLLLRHLHFAQMCDLRDILTDDWPAVTTSLPRVLYDKDDPLPAEIDDLGNSCRSQMAEGVFRHFGKGQIKPHSAGSEPHPVNPKAIEVMNEIGIDISTHTSKHLAGYLSEKFDYVITVCDNANKTCPTFPGEATRLHWPYDDPAAAEGTDEQILAVFRRVRDEIKEKIEEWVKENV